MSDRVHFDPTSHILYAVGDPLSIDRHAQCFTNTMHRLLNEGAADIQLKPTKREKDK